MVEPRAKLDQKYLEKYPNGRFAINKDEKYIGLQWEPKRPTSHCRFKCISVKLYNQNYGIKTGATMDSNGLICETYASNSIFSKSNYYETLYKFLIACERQNVSEKLIQTFTERYINRSKEGFVI